MSAADNSEHLTPPLPQPSDELMAWNAAFEAVRYSLHNPDAHGGGAIGKTTVMLLALGIDPEMPMRELRRRLALPSTSPTDGAS